MSGTSEALSCFKVIGRIHLARTQKKAKLEEDVEDGLLVEADEVTNSKALPAVEATSGDDCASGT